MNTVLVTGGSGFLAGHCILKLLGAGYPVRTTLRSRERESDVRAMLKEGGVNGEARLEFVEADLLKDKGWVQAAEGCRYVMHVASPFPVAVPRHEDEVLKPARDGTLRVLRAAREAGVERVVLTSSFAAIGYGHPDQDKPFDETSWTNLDGFGVQPYQKSKTLAERAAWDFVANNGKMELSVVNPVGIFGPALGPDYSTSLILVQRLMDGGMPGCPRISFGVVDVRDVADLHLRAMTSPAAKGERFLAVAGQFMSILDIAIVLKERMGHAARRVPTRQLPDFMIRFGAAFDRAARQILPELGRNKQAVSDKAKNVLGWEPRSREDAIVASGESMLRLGLLKSRK
jgi:nucleoside-diphosphate-sugar epimerase